MVGVEEEEAEGVEGVVDGVLAAVGAGAPSHWARRQRT